MSSPAARIAWLVVWRRRRRLSTSGRPWQPMPSPMRQKVLLAKLRRSRWRNMGNNGHSRSRSMASHWMSSPDREGQGPRFGSGEAPRCNTSDGMRSAPQPQALACVLVLARRAGTTRRWRPGMFIWAC